MREQAHLTLDEAAPRLYRTRSALSRIENGETAADPNLVISMMDLYDHYDPTLVELAVECRRKGWWRAYGLEDRGYVDLETEACEVLALQLLYIPGLLQTEAYMRAVFSSGTVRRTEEELANQVKARLFRQHRLIDKELPLRLHAIIDESALHWGLGGPDVTAEQLRHLVERSALDTVTLQVLPRGGKPHQGMDGAFTMLRFAEDEDPDLLYVEHAAGSVHFEDRPGVGEVRKARLIFEDLRSEALSPEDSLVLIEQAASRC